MLFDFDGTLAPIVERPEDARPAEGVGLLLAELAGRYGVVAVVSGRPVAFLAAWLPAEVDLSGLYGLEHRLGGVMASEPGTERWRGAVAQAVGRLHESGPDGLLVEAKGLSVTVHYRSRPELAPVAERLAREVGQAVGLEVRPAKMSVELHPPVATDKGSVVRSLAAGASAVLFAGDDVGDAPAFAALQELAAAGVDALGLLVTTSETPPELAPLADHRLAGPAALLEVLADLAGPGSS